jgi:anti-sigma regulatory factor (Ser/Thr protein kinase)
MTIAATDIAVVYPIACSPRLIMGFIRNRDDLLELELPRNRSCAVAARRFVERAVGAMLSGERLDDLKLVVTELVENAYVHGRGEIVLRLRPRRDAVRVEVVDQGRGARVGIREQNRDPGGWGLRLVDQLAESWGVHNGITHVWAVVRLR